MQLVGTVFLAMSLGQAVPSDSASAPPANERQADVARLAQRVIREQRFLSESSSEPLSPHPEPVLRWSNPTAGEVYGDVYVWTDRGRPALVASIFRWFQPDWGATLELCSLAPTSLRGLTGEREFWHPDASRLKWQRISDAPTPSATLAGRLSQMKRIVAEFSATLADGRNAKTAPVSRRLRLLPQPPFRYPPPSSESDYLDGALFTFVEGTDPEVLLLVEAVVERGAAAWRFGAVRMNNHELRVFHRDQPVWQVPAVTWQEMRQHPREPYSQFVVDADSGRVKP